MPRLTRKDSEVTLVIADALALIDKVAEFYAKYHVLEYADRLVVLARLKTTRRQWTDCARFEQSHFDFIDALITDLRAHFAEWMQDERVARKRWTRHPALDLDRLISKAASTTALIQEMIALEHRKLSMAEEIQPAWT